MKTALGAFIIFFTMRCAFADEWHVYSEEEGGGCWQLTNAFANAVGGDTITIHKGTYAFTGDDLMMRYGSSSENGACLRSTAGNLTIQGDPDVPREAIVLDGTSDDANSVLRQIMRLEGADYTVRHLTFNRGAANTGNDTFTFSGGGVCFTTKKAQNNSTVEDCAFLNCFAKAGSAVYAANTIRNCLFENNVSVWKQSGCTVNEVVDIYDSSFMKNDRGCVRGHSGVMSNCVFNANTSSDRCHGLILYQTGSVIDCTFSNNATVALYLHNDYGTWVPSEIRGCSFIDNSDSLYSAGIGGIIPCTTMITNCLFKGDLQLSNCTAKVTGCRFLSGTTKGMIAACPDVEDCVFEGNGKTLTGSEAANIYAVSDCSFKRCRFENLLCRWSSGFLNVRRMENCLIAGCAQWGAGGGALFAHTDGLSADYVNCTVVTNGGVDCMFVNTAGEGTITFKNTLFAQNKVCGQNWGAIDFVCNGSETAFYSTLKMDHSIFKAGNMSGTVPVACTGCSNLLEPRPGKDVYVNPDPVNPRFLKDGYAGAGDPFGVDRKSICVNAGDNGDWTAADTDLAGLSRVWAPADTDQIVDIGCFENHDKVPGLWIFIR